MVSFQQQQDDLLWVYPKIDEKLKQQIIKEFRIHPVTAQILISRGFTDLKEIHDYLYAKLPDLHDPFLLEGMSVAVKRILSAREKGEGILIYGDNDVDGMTGTALLADFLSLIGANVHYYVSSRGISRNELIIEALEYAKSKNCALIITVDCGITAAEEIRRIAEHGVDVIITDHHEPTETIPHCTATLNPKLKNSTYPNRELTGVGVAFKLAHGITNQLSPKELPKKIDLKRYLDLVALGTVADMGVLKGENRILVRYGLKELQKTKRVGLAQLVSICDLDLKEVSASDIVFKIAPRLNSLGRIDDPVKGVKLLRIKNEKEAKEMAIALNLNNTERQKIERTMSIEAEEMLKTDPTILDNRAIFLHSDKWHPGVIAIISTRLSKHFNRPAVLIAVEGGMGKGSLRSISQLPLLPTLKECSDLLQNWGGHDLAAGLSLPVENIPQFKKRFLKLANASLREEDVKSKLYLDAEVEFHELTFDLIESNKLLEPFGNENMPPILYAKATQAWAPRVIGKAHLKLFLAQGDRILEGVAMHRGDDRLALKGRKGELEVAFTPQINLFQKGSIQLLLKDFR
jgi:single-stranded-DNA-specific exonuclease